jgi:hypothetical protein
VSVPNDSDTFFSNKNVPHGRVNGAAPLRIFSQLLNKRQKRKKRKEKRADRPKAARAHGCVADWPIVSDR